MNIQQCFSNKKITIPTVIFLLTFNVNAYAIQCVDYIKQNYSQYSDMSGNANTWWSKTDKITKQYTPSVGSVLVFPGPSAAGHVAYVAKVISSKEILVNHANWNRNTGAVDGSIWKNVRIQDVSDGNKWTKVKMEFGSSGQLGSTSYNTYGFVVPIPPPTKVAVNCPVTTLNVLKTSACIATAYYKDGTNKSVTELSSWTDNNTSVAPISSKGVVTAKAIALDTPIIVTATFKNIKGTANLTISGLDGKSPIETGCDKDAKSAIKPNTISNGKVELLWSEKCGANWAKATATNSKSLVSAEVKRDKTSSGIKSGKGSISSNMLYGRNIKVCAIGTIDKVTDTVCY